MLQRKEIGKTRTKRSQADAMLNRECVTPNGDRYILTSYVKVGNSYHYTYEWINAPKSVTDITTNRTRSKTSLSLEEIIQWIKTLKDLVNI